MFIEFSKVKEKSFQPLFHWVPSSTSFQYHSCWSRQRIRPATIRTWSPFHLISAPVTTSCSYRETTFPWRQWEDSMNEVGRFFSPQFEATSCAADSAAPPSRLQQVVTVRPAWTAACEWNYQTFRVCTDGLEWLVLTHSNSVFFPLNVRK